MNSDELCQYIRATVNKYDGREEPEGSSLKNILTELLKILFLAEGDWVSDRVHDTDADRVAFALRERFPEYEFESNIRSSDWRKQCDEGYAWVRVRPHVEDPDKLKEMRKFSQDFLK